MASADLREELKCSICLEIYRDPVNLPCGHNYCRSCIHRMLDTQEASGAYNCPECRTTFSGRPVLQKNIALCNIVNIFSSANPEQSGSDVHCSYCIYSAVPAIQSCLHCEASLCSNHLRVHSRSAEHVLTEATRTPEKRKCPVHKEVLKYHCIVDDGCICVTCCLAGEHYGHQVELLEVASEKKKDKLRTFLEKLSFQREKIEKKLQDLEGRRHKDPGDEEATVLFPDVRGEMVLYTVSSLIQLFKIKKEKLSKKIRHLQGLCNSSDSVSVVREKDVDLHDFFDEEQEQYNHEDVGDQAVGQISKPQDCLELVLDISTAANNILVSDDLKTVYWSAIYQNRPETSKRFQYNQILSSRFFSSGRHYWEVETSETGDWRLAELSELSHRVEELGGRTSQLNKTKLLLASEVEDVKKQLEEEKKVRALAVSSMSTLKLEYEMLKEQLEEEMEGKSELQRQISRLNGEVTHWRTRYENEAGQRTEELEEARRKLSGRLQEAEEALEVTQAKCSNLEKVKQRLQGEVEDICLDLEKAGAEAAVLDKKQRALDKQIADWRQKYEEMQRELEASQQQCRHYTADLFKIKTAFEETHEQLTSMKRENRALQDEVSDLSEQLQDVTKSVHELQKSRKKAEMEKDEMQAAYEEAEAALEAEESKVVKLQLEMTQLKTDTEKRIQDKEEECEATRKNHQRAMESLQASLEAEVKGRAETTKTKKKLENEVNELENQLESTKRSNAELVRLVKKLQQQIKDVQTQMEDESRQHDDTRNQLNLLERRNSILTSELEEMRSVVEASERSHKTMEMELIDLTDKCNELNNQLLSVSAIKKKLEGDLQQLTAENEDYVNEIRTSEEKVRKAASETFRLAEELRREQEHTQHLQKIKKGQDSQIQELNEKVEEAEQMMLQDGRKLVQKMEAQIKDLELELETEQKKHMETTKTLKKHERRLKELIFQAEEDQKTQQRNQDVIERMQSKVKMYKRMVEEAEEQANLNLSKYRKSISDLDEAEERADVAEAALTKIRSKHRASFRKGFSSGRTSPTALHIRTPSVSGSEARGERLEDNPTSLIPIYLDSLRKFTTD